MIRGIHLNQSLSGAYMKDRISPLYVTRESMTRDRKEHAQFQKEGTEALFCK